MKTTDIVFTDHAIKRMKERGILGQWAWEAVKKSDEIKPGKEKHTTEFIKKINGKILTAIGKRNDIGEWVVLSAWIDPPFQGTADYRERQRHLKILEKNREYSKKIDKASLWGKLWLTFRKQLGL